MASRKSFTSPVDIIEFDINGEDYAAVGSLSADPFIAFLGVVGQLGKSGEKAKKAAEEGEEEGSSFDIEQLERQKQLMVDAVSLCMTADSRDRLIAGLAGEGEVPVPLDILQEVLMWLLSEYKLSAADDDDDEEDDGERPLEQSSDSATGSKPTEDSSEDD